MPPIVASVGDAPPASSASERLARIITTSAVPIAPPTCWTVPSSELPWEYSLGLSTPRPIVNSGVNSAARLTMSTMWATRIIQIGVVAPTKAKPVIAARRPTAPGITRTREPRSS